MVAEWTRYWKANREILLQGEFFPSGPASGYPAIVSRKGGRVIAGVYADAVIGLPDGDLEAVDLVNAKATRSLVLELLRPMGRVKVTTFDTRGRVVYEDTRSLAASIHRFEAPPSGRVEIRRQ
jgi:hypothetical protein